MWGCPEPKSLFISCVMSNSYGTEIEIMASFWPVDNTEKQEYGQSMSNFWGQVFYVFMAKESPN